MKKIKRLLDVFIILSIASIVFVLITGGERSHFLGLRFSLQNFYNPIVFLIFFFSARILIISNENLIKLKTALCILLGAMFVGYMMKFMSAPFIFVVSFACLSFSLIVALLPGICVLVSNLIWKLSSPGTRKNYAQDKLQLKIIAFAGLTFFFLWRGIINSYLPSEMLHPLSLAGDAGVLVFSIFLIWGLVKPDKKKILFAGFGLFLLFNFALIAVSLNTAKKPEAASIEAIKSLPYLTWVPAKNTKDKRGVTIYDEEKAFKGLNIYNSRNLPVANIIDMTGNVLHKWSAAVKKGTNWQHIEMCKNGDLLAIVSDKMLIRLDWDSNVRWITKSRFHHDIAVAENKDIYVLTQKEDLVFYSGLPLPILNNYISVLSPDGKIKKEISLFNVLKEEIPLDRFIKTFTYIIKPRSLKRIFSNKIEGRYVLSNLIGLDIFHTNTLEVIGRSIDGLCKKGDILISSRYLDLVAIIDIETEKVIWKWGPEVLSWPHHPNFLKNKNILIFDNGVINGYSRIVELNPFTKNIIWEYEADPPDKFYSESRGSGQRLPNGNTLITESDSGHVFEVTRDGEIVWEFYNPEIKKAKGKRAAIYRMMRITDPEAYSTLRELKL